MNDEIAEKAMRALRGDDPRAARSTLARLLEQAPERLDIQHALAVTELRLGEAESALERLDKAEIQARAQADETAATLMGNLILTKAAACEDLYDPAGAEVCYREVTANEEGNPRASLGLAYLLFAWGRLDDGKAAMEAYLQAALDEPEALDGNRAFLTSLRAFESGDLHPRIFIEAHRGAYVEFFDHHARQMEAKGWIAEPARMKRGEDGAIVPVIAEGARPYAAERMDLVDPSTGQHGMVGDEPMIVAQVGFEPLARAPVLLRWPERDLPFPVWISTNCPWNHLRVQVALATPSSEAAEQLDAIIGDWYQAGFNGEFGSHDRGRLHTIDDPESPRDAIIAWNVDCGRSEARAIDDLFKRLSVLHEQVPLRQVVIGRGYVPD